MTFHGKVLLVDDEPHIRKFIGLILKFFGVRRIVEAQNGQEAVELYSREKPDLVLLDVNMPIMDGVEALAAIKSTDPDAVVVVLTSQATRSTVDQCLNLGAANYIRKDTPKETIAEILAETIKDYFPNKIADDTANAPTP